MKKLYLNPQGVPTPKSYHHAVSVDGGLTVYFSGQVAFDADRVIVGVGDALAQTRQAMRNLKSAVEARGWNITDIVCNTTHVVNYEPSQLDGITGTIGEFFPPECMPTNT